MHKYIIHKCIYVFKKSHIFNKSIKLMFMKKIFSYINFIKLLLLIFFFDNS